MTHADFSSIESELREIDENFSSGRLNAFGTQGTQDEIKREMKKVAELEKQVFFRTAAMIHTANEEQHLLEKMLTEQTQVSKTVAMSRLGVGSNATVPLSSFANLSVGGGQQMGMGSSGAPQPSSAAAKNPPDLTSRRGSVRGADAFRTMRSGNTNSPAPQEGGSTPPSVPLSQTPGPTTAGANNTNTAGGEVGGPTSAAAAAAGSGPQAFGDQAQQANGPESYSSNVLFMTDRAFEDVARIFHHKALAMKNVSDNLRQMSKHISNINEAVSKQE